MGKRIGANGRKKTARRRGAKAPGRGRFRLLAVCALTVITVATVKYGAMENALSRVAARVASVGDKAGGTTVKKVVVEGSLHMRPDELLRRGGITLPLTLDRLTRERLQALSVVNPWIERLKIHRSWRGIMTLGISERKPVALLQTGVIRLVDAAGVCMPLDSRTAHSLPLFSGLQDTIGADGIRRTTVESTERMNRFLASAASFDTSFARRITQVHFDDQQTARILLEGSPTMVVISESEATLGLQRLARIWEAVRNDPVLPAKIDLTYRNLAFVTPATTTGAAAGVTVQKKNKG